MSPIDFNQIIESLGALSPEEMKRLRRELDHRLAATLKSTIELPQGSLGAMRDADDELDQIVEQAMRNRRERPWRLPVGE